MPSRNPHDSLGRVLSQGGEIRIASGISAGYSASKISGLFTGKLSSLIGTERQELIDFALSGVNAAKAIKTADPDLPMDLNTIPTNPFLFGDDPAGRRILALMTMQLPDSDRVFDRRVTLADAISLNALILELLRDAQRDTVTLNLAKGKPVDEPDEPAIIDLAFIEKAF